MKRTVDAMDNQTKVIAQCLGYSGCKGYTDTAKAILTPLLYV